MEPTDLTIEILRSIRDEIRGLKQTTEERFESLERTTNERFDRLEGRLDRHEQILVRHEQILIQLVRGQERHEQVLGKLIVEVQGLGSRIDNIITGPLGEKVRDLDRRVTQLEQHAAA